MGGSRPSWAKGRFGSSATRRSGSLTSSVSRSIASIPRLPKGRAGMRPSRSASSSRRRAAASSPGCRAGSIASTRRRAGSSCWSKSSRIYPDNRLNDGVVDPARAGLWFGTMDNGERAKTGAFYCFHKRQANADQPHRHRHHQWARRLAGRQDALLGRHARRHDFGLRDLATMACSDLRSWSSGSIRAKGIPTARRSTAKAASGSGSTRVGKRAVIRQRASSSSAFAFPVSNITKIAFGGNDLRHGFRDDRTPSAEAGADGAAAAGGIAVRVPCRSAGHCLPGRRRLTINDMLRYANALTTPCVPMHP